MMSFDSSSNKELLNKLSREWTVVWEGPLPSGSPWSDPWWQANNCCLWCKFLSRRKHAKFKWLPVFRSATVSFHLRYSLEFSYSQDSHYRRHKKGLSECFSWPPRSWLSTLPVGTWCDKQTPKHSTWLSCFWCFFQSLFTSLLLISAKNLLNRCLKVSTWMIMWVAMI